MTGAYFRRRQHAMPQKVAAFFLAFVASLAAADPAPLPSQPGELPAASTTADTRTGSSGKTPLQRQPVAAPEAVDLDAAADITISPRSNEFRRELLDHRAKTVDWWLAATAIFLTLFGTLFGIVVAVAGYLSFKRFREIEAEARENVKSCRIYTEEAGKLVGKIKERRDEVESIAKELTAKVVDNDPDEARRAADSVQENPTASPIFLAIADTVQLQQQGNIEKAIEIWHAVAVISEGSDKELSAQAWFSVGYLSQEYKKNSLETAIHAYDQAIRSKSDFSEAYNNRGNAKSSLGRHEEAIADYDEAIRLKSDNAEAYYNRGVTKNNLGRHEEAIADYNETIRLKSDNAEAYNNRGVTKNNLGRHEEAIADYDEAIRLKSDDAEAYNNRGNAKSDLGRHGEAIADYDEAIRLKSDYAEAYNNRGIAKKNLGRHEEAIADYDEAIRLKSEYAKVYYNRGNAKNNLGRHEEAIADYDEAIRLKFDYAEAYNNRGNAKNNLGRHEEAIADYDEVIRLKPDLVEVYNNRGNAKNDLSRHEEAIADYDEVIRLKPDSVKAYYNRGNANAFLNRIDEARQDFETAIILARNAGDETLASDAERALKKLSDEQDP